MLCILKSHHLFSWRMLLYLHLTRQCFSSVQDKDWHVYTNTLQEWWMYFSKHSFVTPLSNYQLLLQSEGVNPVHGWACLLQLQSKLKKLPPYSSVFKKNTDIISLGWFFWFILVLLLAGFVVVFFLLCSYGCYENKLCNLKCAGISVCCTLHNKCKCLTVIPVRRHS